MNQMIDHGSINKQDRKGTRPLRNIAVTMFQELKYPSPDHHSTPILINFMRTPARVNFADFENINEYQGYSYTTSQTTSHQPHHHTKMSPVHQSLPFMIFSCGGKFVGGGGFKWFCLVFSFVDFFNIFHRCAHYLDCSQNYITSPVQPCPTTVMLSPKMKR
jgi:hypothetical protein